MIEITFHNKVEIRALAQIFRESQLISSVVAGPGETCILSAESGTYDLFIKHGMTGLELARKLGGKARRITLTRLKGRYVVT
jgi:hypothetical protein